MIFFLKKIWYTLQARRKYCVYHVIEDNKDRYVISPFRFRKSKVLSEYWNEQNNTDLLEVSCRANNFRKAYIGSKLVYVKRLKV
jgi:hypothetical protein